MKRRAWPAFRFPFVERPARTATWLLAVAALAGCGDDDGGLDAALVDGGGNLDAASVDGSTLDAAPVDGGPSDGSALVDATSDAADWPPLPAPLGPLPAASAATFDRFKTSDSCTNCHAWDGTGAMEDAAGRDVSPVTLWRGSMMALAARDPYYLAAMSHEIAVSPAATELIEATCTRCHAPAAQEGLSVSGAHPTFATLTTETTAAAQIARDGVTCTVCHQIEPDNLGDPASFSGGFLIGAGNVAYGPHASPVEMNMVNATGYRPTLGNHVAESEHCATCHTLFTRSVDAAGTVTGPEFPEQVPYLEWLASDYAEGGPREASCQSCHVPTTDEDGNPIRTAIASRPRNLGARAPFGRHVFAGANAYMLELFAENAAWSNAGVPVADLLASANAAQAMLHEAAELNVAVRRDAGTLVVDVDVVNLAGHKLPTSYPSRRVFLRVEALDASGAVQWASGRTNAQGYLVDAAGRPIDGSHVVLPHRDVIEREDHVQVYEAMMQDATGAPTRVLLHATEYAKDTRLLPRGWRADHPDADAMRPVGVEGDDDFVPGGDRVTYRVPSATIASLRVSLLYQSIPPTTVDGLRDHPTPATSRFVAMTEATPPTPRLLVEVVRAVE